MASVLPTSPDPIWLVGTNGTVEWVSPAVDEVLGYTSTELGGTNLFALIHPDDQERMVEHTTRLVALGTSPGQRCLRLRYKHARGHWLVLEANQRVLSEGGQGSGLIMVTRDVTTAAQREEAEQRAREDAERLSRAKDELLSCMTHELRTPLHAILGFGQLLQRDGLSGEQGESVAQILRAGHHLLRLIAQTEDSVRIKGDDRGPAVEPVVLGEVVEECVGLVEPLARARAIRLPRRLPDAATAVVAADRQRLKQILINLLSNAIKYNVESGLVRMDCHRRSSDRLRLSVSDTGPGISAEVAERVFLPYERLAAGELGVEGTGLGLSIAKRLAEAMDATLGVDSVVGQGSTFWLDLPMSALDTDPYQVPLASCQRGGSSGW